MVEFDASTVFRKLATRLKMRHLVLLLQIRQHGSVTRAAEHLASSQPAVTNTLAEIEDMFGAPLFLRSARGMTPTALGNVVLERAHAMTGDLDHLVRDMAAVASGFAAHLQVGVIPFVPGQLLSGAIQRTRPDGDRRVTITIHEGSSQQLLAKLRDHTIDIVIAQAAASLDLGGVKMEVLYQQQPRLIAHRRLAARLTRARPDWQKLAALDWILGEPHSAIREQIDELFLNAGQRPPAPLIETQSTRLIGELIVAGEQSVSIVPADVAEELVRIAGVAIVPWSFAWTLPPVALFTRTSARVGREEKETTAVKPAIAGGVMPLSAERLFTQALRELCRLPSAPSRT